MINARALSELGSGIEKVELKDLLAQWQGGGRTTRSARKSGSGPIAPPSPAPTQSTSPIKPTTSSPTSHADVHNGVIADTPTSRPVSRSSELTAPPATSPISSHTGDTTESEPSPVVSHTGDTTESEPSPKGLKRKRDSVADSVGDTDAASVKITRLSVKATAVPAAKKRKSIPAAISSPYFETLNVLPDKPIRRRSAPAAKRKSSDALVEADAEYTISKPPAVKSAQRPRANRKVNNSQPDFTPPPTLTLEQRIARFDINPRVLGAVTDDTILLHAAQYQHLSHLKPENKTETVGTPTAKSLSADAIADFSGDFRARQKAICTSKPFMRGAFFNGHGLDRDYIGTGVLLSRAGGGMSTDEDGNTTYTVSNDAKNQIECIRMNMKMKRPVLIFIGNKAKHAHFKFPENVNIVLLEWFMPTHAWHEKNGKNLVVRFRFENIQEETAWWRTKANESGDNQEPAELGDYPAPVERTCESCNATYQLTYVQGWCCLNHECNLFWKLSDGTELSTVGLAYHPHWLKQRTNFDGMHPPYDFKLQPEISPEDFARQVSAATSADAHAIRCPRCGYVEVRIQWNRWTCPAEDCGFHVELPPAPISASEVMSFEHPIGDGPPHPQIDIDPAGMALGLQHVLTSRFLHGHRVTVIPLDGDGTGPKNFFCHMQANAAVNREPVLGPDALFELLQHDGFLDQISRPLSKNEQLVGPTYAGQYSQNYGEFYDYYTEVPTKPFSEAPGVVNLARARMAWGGRFIHKLLADDYGKSNVPPLVDFNECLALGYKGENQMSWHDDGEDSVYGIVGTMALGGEAHFSIRVHKNRYLGYSKSDNFSTHEPIRGCLSDTWRIEHWPEHKARLEAAKANKNVADVRKEITEELKAHRAEVQKAWKDKEGQLSKIKAALKKDKKNADLKRQETILTQQLKDEKLTIPASPPDLLTFTMRHGDMIWMLGEDMQSWYEHGVFRRFDKYNFPRFAFTFRHILETQKSGKRNDHFHHEPADPGNYPGPKLD